jgi:hypothetical protein
LQLLATGRKWQRAKKGDVVRAYCQENAARFR